MASGRHLPQRLAALGGIAAARGALRIAGDRRVRLTEHRVPAAIIGALAERARPRRFLPLGDRAGIAIAGTIVGDAPHLAAVEPVPDLVRIAEARVAVLLVAPERLAIGVVGVGEVARAPRPPTLADCTRPQGLST